MIFNPADSYRLPQQARGHERAGRILDGCARIIVEKGLASLTMSGIAKASGTAIGSLYHFFPNKEAVLAALRTRHTDAVKVIMQAIRRVSAEDWIRMSTEDLVTQLAMPLVEYLAANPDCLVAPEGQVEKNSGAVELVQEIFQTYDFALRSRMPYYDEPERRRHVMTTLHLPLGLLQMGKEHPELRDEVLALEVPRIFSSYLGALQRPA